MQRRLVFLLLIWLLQGCDKATASSSDPPIEGSCASREFSGEGTYYGADGSGNCSYPKTPDDHRVAAMNQADYSGSAACGACAEVDGPQGTLIVRIVDRCPECRPGDLDLGTKAFAEIANPEAGRVAISWRYVPCETQGAVRFLFKDGSSQWWTAVQVRNHRHAITLFEYRMASAPYKPISRTNYNYFLEAAGMGRGPFDFRLSDVNGNVLEETGIPLELDREISGKGQFPPCQPQDEAP